MIIPRLVVTPQIILGKHIPAGTLIVCSPLATARDPNLFPEPEKFRPERWLLPSGVFDDAKMKGVQRMAQSTQFGRVPHACVGQKLGKTMAVETLWDVILGNEINPGYDVQIVSGIKEGVGMDNVGVQPAWTEHNLGTPFQKGPPVLVRFSELRQ
jgi:hypothetical protein